MNYKIETELVFKGVFTVKAENKAQAKEMVEKHCGLVLGQNIHSVLNDEDIDWDFNVHADKKIKSIKKDD